MPLRPQFTAQDPAPLKSDFLRCKAGRVADYFELAELMCRDALDREESCGAHFREEYRTDEGEAKLRVDRGSS